MATTLCRIVIPADAENAIYLEEIERNCRPQYEWIVAGNVRSVGLAHPECALYMNQHSPSPHKPLNERATLIVQCFKPVVGKYDEVTGDAFILGLSHTDAPDELIRTLTGQHELHLEVQFTPDASWVRQTTVFDDWERAYEAAIEEAKRWEPIQAVRVVP
jgi:hypothetical protein